MASYEIRIRGRVGSSVLASFEDMESAVRPGETVLWGTISDQAQLHGVLERIQLLGLELIEIRQVAGADASVPGADARPVPGADGRPGRGEGSPGAVAE